MYHDKNLEFSRMDFEITNRDLVDLYTKGSSRKLRVDKQVARKFVERVNRIQDAADINDLRVPPSMHFEKLQGFSNRFSIRVDLQWRLEFEIDFTDQDKTVGAARIVKLSNHYK